jgi:Cyanobacterial TRADD-N associated 2-Transmembrane domain
MWGAVSMALSQSLTEKHQACDRIAIAVHSGKLGDTVREHEKLIVQYYEDVQEQAKRSFNTAILISKIGFVVLIVALVYALVRWFAPFPSE